MAVFGGHVVDIDGDVDLENLGHVGGGLIALGNKCRVAGRRVYLHLLLIGEQGQDEAKHENEAPNVVDLHGLCRLCTVLAVGWGGEDVRDDKHDTTSCEDAKALHGEESINEPSPLLVADN